MLKAIWFLETFNMSLYITNCQEGSIICIVTQTYLHKISFFHRMYQKTNIMRHIFLIILGSPKTRVQIQFFYFYRYHIIRYESVNVIPQPYYQLWHLWVTDPSVRYFLHEYVSWKVSHGASISGPLLKILNIEGLDIYILSKIIVIVI